MLYVLSCVGRKQWTTISHIYYKAKSLLTLNHETYMCLLNIPFQIQSLFAVILPSTLLERLNTRFWIVAVKMYAY